MHGKTNHCQFPGLLHVGTRAGERDRVKLWRRDDNDAGGWALGDVSRGSSRLTQQSLKLPLSRLSPELERSEKMELCKRLMLYICTNAPSSPKHFTDQASSSACSARAAPQPRDMGGLLPAAGRSPRML